MWIVFGILLITCVLGIHFYVPFLITLVLFAAMLTAAGVALMPANELLGSDEES